MMFGFSRTYCAAVLFIGLMAVSCLKLEERGPESFAKPKAPGLVVKDNGSLVFQLSSTVGANEAGRISECGFYYGKDNNLKGASKVDSKISGVTFSTELTLKEYGATFYFKSYVSNGAGDEVLSDVKTVTLKEFQNYIKFTSPYLVSYGQNSAKISVKYEAADGMEISDFGVCYGKTADLDVSKDCVKVGDDGLAIIPKLEIGKTYYVRAYVKEGVNVAYSDAVPFAVYGTPIVHTYENPDVDTSSADLKGKVESDCGKQVTERGFLWRIGAVEVLDVSKDTKIKCGTGIGEFSYPLTGLKPNQTYSFCAYAVNEEGVSYGKVIRFTTGIALPEVKTPSASEVTSNTAVLKFELISDGGDAVSDAGFYYGTKSNVGPESGKRISANRSGSSYSVKLQGLTKTTTYFVRSYAVNSAGENISKEISFVTSATMAEIITLEVKEITAGSAVSGGNITDDGGSAVQSRGLVWSTSEYPTIFDAAKVECGSGEGTFSGTITGLKPNTSYYVRAYATTSVGTAYGDDIRFTTLVDMPTVGDVVVSSKKSTSAKISASLLSDGGETPNQVGFYYSTSDKVNPDSSQKIISSLSGTSFSTEIYGLTRATQYYVRAFAVNSLGEALGEIQHFTTLPEAPVVETGDVTDIADIMASCGGIIVDDGGETITSKGVIWSTSSNPTYSLSTKTDEGSGSDSFVSTMKPLIFSKKYYVRAYAANSVGISYGEIKEFTTDPLHVSPLATALSYPDATPVCLIETVVAVTGQGFLLSDAYGNMLYVDAGYGWDRNVKISDKVRVEGEMDTYCGNRKLTFWNSSVNGTTTVPDMESVDLNNVNLAEFAKAGHAPCKVEVIGTLIYNNGNYKVEIGNNSIAALVYPISDMTKFIGKTVLVNGYYLWTSNSSSYETVVSLACTDINIPDEHVPDLTAGGKSANSYIISEAGPYRFRMFKGNSSESVGSVSKVEVLWESFGTSVKTWEGDLITDVLYRNGYIVFETTDTFTEGNAVIAARDSRGRILWSWHIWMTDEPDECVYANNAGVMMDRNLGATSATPGEVGALGLLYQWGRKDPFIGSSTVNRTTEAKSTGTFNQIRSTETTGTISYATEHPMTFITYNSLNDDWYYTGTRTTDNERWGSTKTIYDPCPAGWRVPDGGNYGVWKTAGITSIGSHPYDRSNEGILVKSPASSPSTWYPAAGCRSYQDGSLDSVGTNGNFWSVTPRGDLYAYILYFGEASLMPTLDTQRAFGLSVRCVKE